MPLAVSEEIEVSYELEPEEIPEIIELEIEAVEESIPEIAGELDLLEASLMEDAEDNSEVLATESNAENTAGIAIDETNFPDDSFRAYISETCDVDGNNFLSNAEIDAVTEIRNCMYCFVQGI